MSPEDRLHYNTVLQQDDFNLIEDIAECAIRSTIKRLSERQYSVRFLLLVPDHEVLVCEKRMCNIPRTGDVLHFDFNEGIELNEYFDPQKPYIVSGVRWHIAVEETNEYTPDVKVTVIIKGARYT